MAKEKAVIVADGGVGIEQFWKDNGNKVLALTAAVGAGAAALFLVKAFFDARRRRKILGESVVVNLGQFVETAVELGEDHGQDVVAAVAKELAGEVNDGELSEALAAVAAIASEKRKIRKVK